MSLAPLHKRKAPLIKDFLATVLHRVTFFIKHLQNMPTQFRVRLYSACISSRDFKICKPSQTFKLKIALVQNLNTQTTWRLWSQCPSVVMGALHNLLFKAPLLTSLQYLYVTRLWRTVNVVNRAYVSTDLQIQML